MKAIAFFGVLFFALIIALGVVLFMLYERYLVEEVALAPVVNDTIEEPILYSPNDMLFYDNIRFLNISISYYIEPECDEVRAENARDAFKILGDATILDFYEKEKGEIQVSCSEDARELPNEYFVVGEGGPNALINTGKYAVILNGTIYLYKDGTCDEPVVALHEILHVVGFKHSEDKRSIMYEVSSCKQGLDETIISKIEELYKEPVLPDMTFANVTATKKGRYLNFDAEITNVGLAKSENVFMKVYSGKKEVDSYKLESFEMGTGKIIRVENSRIAYSSENVTFVIDPDNRVSEIDEDNNRLELVVK